MLADVRSSNLIGELSAGWRTMLVVPELAAELDLLHQTITTRKVKS
jgi:hypothetical protein